MGKRRRHLLCIVLLAVTGLAVSAAGASGDALSTSSRGFRITFAPMYFHAEGLRVECPVTLEGSFRSSTIAKEFASLIGTITSAAAGACSSGSVTMLAGTLPWGLYYLGFTGTLPNITQIKLMLAPMNFSWTGWVTCLYQALGDSAIELNASRNTSTGQMGSMSPETYLIEPITGTGSFCIGGFPATLTGTGIVTVPGGREGIFIRLV